jgi:hypothetical protein
MAPILPLNWAVAAYAVDVSNGIHNLLKFCLGIKVILSASPYLARLGSLGSVIIKVVPPGFEMKVMAPECSLIIRYEIESPNPIPFGFVVKKGSKILPLT